jgi:hypothetical protein
MNPATEKSKSLRIVAGKKEPRQVSFAGGGEALFVVLSYDPVFEGPVVDFAFLVVPDGAGTLDRCDQKTSKDACRHGSSPFRLILSH